MKVGTYTHLTIKARLFGCALLMTSAACGSRTSLLQEEDAGTATDTPAQESSGNSGGRAGSSTVRAGRGGTAGASGVAGRAAAGGRAGRAGRGGEQGEDEEPRGGAGGRGNPRDRDAAADSGDPDDQGEEEPTTAGTGGEASGGSGGEQAGAGGEAAGAAGEGGEPAAGSGGSEAEPVDAGTQQPEEPTEPTGDRLTALTPERTSEICTRIESATANQPWGDAVRGWCSRGALGTPECPTSQQSCVDGASIIPICTETVPDCPDITIEEFVTCRTDTLLSFVEFNRTITCDTPNSLPSEPEVASCVGPNQRCAALPGLRR